MKRIIFWLFVILELSGPIIGIFMAISLVAGLILWAITGNEHSVFEEIFGIAMYGLQIYGIWFLISGLISLCILAKKVNKN